MSTVLPTEAACNCVAETRCPQGHRSGTRPRARQSVLPSRCRAIQHAALRCGSLLQGNSFLHPVDAELSLLWQCEARLGQAEQAEYQARMAEARAANLEAAAEQAEAEAETLLHIWSSYNFALSCVGTDKRDKDAKRTDTEPKPSSQMGQLQSK